MSCFVMFRVRTPTAAAGSRGRFASHGGLPAVASSVTPASAFAGATMGGATLFRAYRVPARAGVGAGAVRAPDCPPAREGRGASPARRPVGGEGSVTGRVSFRVAAAPAFAGAPVLCAGSAPGTEHARHDPGSGKAGRPLQKNAPQKRPRLTASGFVFAFYSGIASSGLQAPVRKLFSSPGLTA